MSGRKKLAGKADEVKGRAKEAMGEDLGRPGMAREGRLEQRQGAARSAMEKIKDMLRSKR